MTALTMPRVGSHSRRLQRARRRRGTTTVEFAICLPLVLLLFFGALEFSRINMLRHTIAQAAYEGARRGIVPGATADQVRTAATDVLDSISATSYTIDVVPSTLAPETTQVTVSISLPLPENCWVPSVFFSSSTVSKSFTMEREKYETVTVP
jgi:Flp pilus assembly protein TadG